MILNDGLFLFPKAKEARDYCRREYNRDGPAEALARRMLRQAFGPDKCRLTRDAASRTTPPTRPANPHLMRSRDCVARDSAHYNPFLSLHRAMMARYVTT